MQSRRKFLFGVTGGVTTACVSFPAFASGQRYSRDNDKFFRAVADGNLAEVGSQLKSRPDLLTATDPMGKSAFTVALISRQPEVASFLRSEGYQVDLHEAAFALDWPEFESLCELNPTLVNEVHPVGGTAMFAAALGGAGNDMWRVYAATGEPNIVASDGGDSAVQAALTVPDLATAEMTAATLLSNAADPNGGSAARPALHRAAKRGSHEIVELLIRKGADIDARDAESRTAEEVAADAGQTAVAELLKRHGEIPRDHSTSREAYNVNATPYQPPDITDIAIAQRRQFVGAAHRLLESVRQSIASDPRIVHSVATTGERAVEAAAHMGNRQIAELLLSEGAPYSLPTAVMMGDITRAKELLREDPLRIHERGAHDFALLWYPAIGDCDLEMTELLLDHGAEVERQHFLGTTALHWACMSGDAELVELLIANGADVNRVGRKFDPSGQTPLQRTKDKTIAAILRRHGAKSEQD